MPLKCATETGEMVLAFNYDAISWKELAEKNRRMGTLVMPCCGRPVVLKRSHLGTRFFAHARREGSACPSESEEHLLAKDLVAKAVVQAGWNAETEAVLKPHGLVADVLATKGKKCVAFEIQWSRQKKNDTERRHAAYEKAGIRALWLFKQWDYPRCKEIPAFRLVRDTESRSFQVWIWRSGHDYEKVNTPAQAIELQEFVSGALVGHLKWMPAIGLTVPTIMHLATHKCLCGHMASVVAEIELDINRILADHGNPKLWVSSFGELPEPLRTSKMRNFLKANGVTLHFGVTKWPHRWGNHEFSRYVYNSCAKCGELIEQHSAWGQTRKAEFELQIILSEQLVQKVHELKEHLQRWWFGRNLVRVSRM